jgi:predicted transcriptional regulator
MTKRDSQQVAHAVVELHDVQDELRGLATVADEPRIAELVEQLDEIAARLESAATRTPGLSVAAASEYLGVSEPTIRSWLQRDVLSPVDGVKPILIDPASLRTVHRLLAELRERAEDPTWLRSFVDYVHDLAVLRSPAIQQGLADMKAGNLEPA